MKKPRQLTDEEVVEMAKRAGVPVERLRKSIEVYEAAREAKRLARRERRQKRIPQSEKPPN
jgi:hypothetical protein